MTTLLVLLLQSTALLLLGLLALRLTRRFGPSVQSLVGRASLVGVALLLLLAPLSGRIAPVWRIPTPVRPSPALPPSGSASAEREGKEVKTGAGVLLAAPSIMPAPPAAPKLPPLSLPPVSVSTAAPLPSAAEPAVQGDAASSAPTPSAFPAPRPPASGGPLRSKEVGFFLPTLLLLLWLAGCRWHLMRLRRTAAEITSGPAAALLAELTPHPPLLLTHPSVQSPFLAGTHRPAIFLPTAFAAEFAPDALRAVFLHELAHRDRRDNFWTLAARILAAILWFQPLLWLLLCKLEHISEDACDRAVLAARCPPRAYAACLLSLAERPPFARRERTLTAGVAPFRSSVGRRISRILSQGVPSMPAVTLRLRLSVAALTVAAATGGAFLVSSAPAQTQPKPAPFVTPEMVKFHAEQQQDIQNLKAIGLAMIHYEQDHHECYPEASHWMNQIAPYLPDRSVLFDPFQPGTPRYGYAFNRNCSQKSLAAFSAPAETVAVYESRLGTRNASDTGQLPFLHSVPRPGMTPWTGSGYGFADGHAKWFTPEVRPSFALDGGENTSSEPPANPSIVGTWLCSHDDGTGNVLIFSTNGTIEEVGPWPGSSTAVDHSYGPNSVAGHSYGHYRTTGPNLMYAFNRVWVEGEKPWTGANPEKHRYIYSISGDTLILRWSGHKSVSHRVPAYTKAILGLKPSTSAVVSLPNKPLDQAQFLAGLTPVQGPGVVVTLRDSKKSLPSSAGMPAGLPPPNIIHDSDVNQVVNELKAAGAEAITVNNQRLVATSAVRCLGPTVYINNTPQEPPFIIKAIGDPKALAGALNIPGGIADQLKNYDKAMFAVQQAATLTLAAYIGKGEMRYAKPVSAANVPALPAPPFEVIVALDSRGSYFLDGVQLPESQIGPFLAARVRQNPNLTAVIKADKNQPYSRVIKLLDVVKQAGIHSLFIAPPTSSGTQATFLPFAVPKRSFAVNYRVPSQGIHAVQVYVTDATGRHLASAKTYKPGTQVNLPVTAEGRLVSFQIYDNGRLTKKTQQITSGPAPTADTSQNQAVTGMHTVVGYGLVAWKSGKEFQCRALKGSLASRLGLLTDRNYLILAVNGQPVPQSAAQLAEIARAAPPLRLLLKFPRQPARTVTFRTKAAYPTPTDAANAESRAKEVQSAQGEAAKAQAALAQTNRQLTEKVRTLLPQATPAALAKAVNLEKQIGWSLDRMNFAKQYAEWGQRKHNPKSKIWTASLEANVHIYLNPETAEEAQIFPQTADSRQQLARIHILAKQVGNMQVTMTEKRIQAMAVASVLHQRSPDISL